MSILKKSTYLTTNVSEKILQIFAIFLLLYNYINVYIIFEIYVNKNKYILTV